MTAGQTRPADPDLVNVYTKSGVTADIADPKDASRQYVLRRVQPGLTTELAGLFGRWRVVGLERAGKTEPPAAPGEARFNGEHLLLTHGDKSESFRIRLDAGHSPKRIDLIPHGVNLEPKPGARPQLGVYELDGDKLAIRWAGPDDRPAGLASTAGDAGPAVFRLERVRRDQ